MAHQAGNFLQWKGTKVCIDLSCVCGESAHYDGEFLYYWQCMCGQVWKMGDEVSMTPVSLSDLDGQHAVIQGPPGSRFESQHGRLTPPDRL